MAKETVTVTRTDKGLDKLLAEIKTLAQLKATVGYQGAGGLNQATPGGPTTAEVAAWNEFGTKTIPSRPFLRQGLNQAGPSLQVITNDGADGLVNGTKDATSFVASLAKDLSDKVRQQISSAGSWAAPNAESTVEAKGSSTPLHAGHDRLSKDLTWAVLQGQSVVEEGT